MDIDLDQYMDHFYDILKEYDERYPRDRFEIAVLASRRGLMLLQNWHGVYQYDPINFCTYLFAHKIIYIDSEYIRSSNGQNSVIAPVIGCKNRDDFPLNARVGELVFYNGALREITAIDDLSGLIRDTIISVSDVRGEIFEDIRGFEIGTNNTKTERLRRFREKQNWMHWRAEEVIRDAWADNPDISEIANYFNSLAIT